MTKNTFILSLSFLWLCLNLMRYNLFGYMDTWEMFLKMDIVSWAIVIAILFLLSDNKLLKSLFLFTFIIMLSALMNAFSFNPDEPNCSELVFLAAAIVSVCLYNYKLIIEQSLTAWKIIKHLFQVLMERMKAKLRGG